MQKTLTEILQCATNEHFSVPRGQELRIVRFKDRIMKYELPFKKFGVGMNFVNTNWNVYQFIWLKNNLFVHYEMLLQFKMTDFFDFTF